MDTTMCLVPWKRAIAAVGRGRSFRDIRDPVAPLALRCRYTFRRSSNGRAHYANPWGGKNCPGVTVLFAGKTTTKESPWRHCWARAACLKSEGNFNDEYGPGCRGRFFAWNHASVGGA